MRRARIQHGPSMPRGGTGLSEVNRKQTGNKPAIKEWSVRRLPNGECYVCLASRASAIEFQVAALALPVFMTCRIVRSVRLARVAKSTCVFWPPEKCARSFVNSFGFSELRGRPNRLLGSGPSILETSGLSALSRSDSYWRSDSSRSRICLRSSVLSSRVGVISQAAVASFRAKIVFSQTLLIKLFLMKSGDFSGGTTRSYSSFITRNTFDA